MANTSKSLLLAVAGGGIFFGALFLFIGWRLWREGRELRSAGVSTDATILKKFRKPEDGSWGGLENYYVRCAWQDAAGATHEIEVKVQSKLWRQLSEGGSVAITYLPGQVETARAGPRWGWKLRGAVGIVIMIFGVIAIIVFPFSALRALL